MKNLYLCALFVLVYEQGQSQNSSFKSHKKGQVFVAWGWNVDAFSKSDISFKGADYDFKLHNVKASDRPSLPITYYDYLKIDRITIPQTNMRIGYFIKDNIAITVGVDHMKYVMNQDQEVKMNGTITREGPHKGTYNGNKVLTTDFLTFEHTDGLNYINAEAEKYFKWYQSKNGLLAVNGFAGVGAGVLVPKTNAKLLNYERNDRFHLSGFGTALKGGVEVMFFKHITLKLENKYGYINMPDIILHQKGIEGKAKQSFFFAQLNGMLGLSVNIGRSTKKVETAK
jgi:hypothetical protein